MILYRADKRDFIVGEIIETAGEFTTQNPEGSEEIENLFESARPNKKPIRSTCLYLFEDLTVAKKHWSKMADGKLYEVEVDEALILHRADMRLVDKAYCTKDEAERNACASEYWSGIETSNPRIEILVENAVVVKIVSKDQNERRKYLVNWPTA